MTEPATHLRSGKFLSLGLFWNLKGRDWEVSRVREVMVFKYIGQGACEGIKGLDPSQDWDLWEVGSCLLRRAPRNI